MSKDSMFIRFGVHKDREVLKQLRDSFAGMVIPAHILAHSSDATRVAVDYIDRLYFIDPMTYILTSDNIKSYVTNNKENTGIKFKTSIEKLTTEYGLIDFFRDRDYKELTPDDFTDDFIQDFCEKNLAFQQTKLNGQAASAYKKYSDILKEVDSESFEAKDHQPTVIIPPYFHSEKTTDRWHSVNVKLALKTLELCDDSLVVSPIILTCAKNLSAKLLKSYEAFSEIILWVADLDESRSISTASQIEKLKLLKAFVETAKAKDVSVTNLYGSYYSALLTKLGLKAFCNGIFYGEYKDYRSKVGGGAPPARFYISKLHKFYLVPVAVALIQDDRDLFDAEPEKSKKLLNYNFENISLMSQDQSLAQKHFLFARESELQLVRSKTLEELVDYLGSNFKNHGDYDDTIKEEKPEQLIAWHKALSNEPEET